MNTAKTARTIRLSSVIIAIAALGAAAGTAGAQGRGRAKQGDNVPPGQRPPAGMCRIWINGVPPGHQPAPTDCETAVRNQPPNSQIIWGDNTNRRGRNVYDDRNRDDRNRDDRDRNDHRNRRDRNGDYRRDANGNPYDPSCVDDNRDGWCDYHPEVRSGVRTRDNSGHAGYPRDGYPGGSNGGPIDRGQYPSQMPAMTGATLIRVGVRTVDVQNWLGRGSLRSETVDNNGDGVPEVATWYDSNGTVLQVWRDDDRDGRADAVEIYQNGQRVQVIR
jgi:hypothetical protein